MAKTNKIPLLFSNLQLNKQIIAESSGIKSIISSGFKLETVSKTISWPKQTRTSNVIQNTSKNVREYHGQNQQGQTMLYKTLQRKQQCVLYNIVCPCWFWPLYCLTFFDVFCITLFVLVGFGHGIV
jgi:hypothetical protein